MDFGYTMDSSRWAYSVVGARGRDSNTLPHQVACGTLSSSARPVTLMRLPA
jgi:hypothetical protein